MNSHNQTIKTIFASFLLVAFAGIVNMATGIAPTINSANAFDLDLADLKCFGVANYCDNNIDNSVIDNSSQDNDVNITDSFNPVTIPVNVCGDNEGSTSTNNSVICTISDVDVSNGSPSTLDLS